MAIGVTLPMRIISFVENIMAVSYTHLLAGGSTDAAAVIKLMNKMFNINAGDDELEKIALKIGADVPYCINGGTALGEGIGEKITKLKPFKDKIVVLVKPPFGVSTKEVYKAFDLSRVVFNPKTSEIINAMENDDVYLSLIHI